tara:strand:- start:140 stop:346 length:207 start_codon:yes stop_codon:yes gene_type:complete
MKFYCVYEKKKPNALIEVYVQQAEAILYVGHFKNYFYEETDLKELSHLISSIHYPDREIFDIYRFLKT